MADREGADGWAILHDRTALPPSDYETLYLFGPLPSKEMADLLEASMNCDCRKTVVPLFFPAGITMVMVSMLDVADILGKDGPVH